MPSLWDNIDTKYKIYDYHIVRSDYGGQIEGVVDHDAYLAMGPVGS